MKGKKSEISRKIFFVLKIKPHPDDFWQFVALSMGTNLMDCGVPVTLGMGVWGGVSFGQL